MGRSFRSRTEGAPRTVTIENFDPDEESDGDGVAPPPAHSLAARQPSQSALFPPSFYGEGGAPAVDVGARRIGVAPTATPQHMPTPPAPALVPSAQPVGPQPPRLPELPPVPLPLSGLHRDASGAGMAAAAAQGASLVDGLEQAWHFFCEDTSAPSSESSSASSDSEALDYNEDGDGELSGGALGGGGDPPGPMGAEFGEPGDVAPGSCPFRTMEEFFAFLLLHGPGHFTERMFNTARAFINHGRPPDKRISGVTTVRNTIAPAVMRACGLPLCESETLPPFLYVLPSAHVQRDFRFAATFDRFFVTDNRVEASRELEPEFYDTNVFQNRAAALSPGPDLPCFGLASRQFRVDSFVDVVLTGGAVHHQVRISHIFFAGAAYGLAHDHAVHAGDLVVVCVTDEGSEAGRIVGRHWLPPFLDGLVWLPAGGGQHDPTTVQAVHPSARAGTSSPPPLVGARRSVEDDAAPGVPRTIHVVVAFYSDDFICRVGRNLSAGAVYMFYPGWMVGDRVSRHAVRTISVTPPSGCSDNVLQAITADLALG